MAVKLRLTRVGKTKQPQYRVIAADSRRARDGRFIEKIGTYNPNTNPASINLNDDKALQWVLNGAQPTDTARAILSYKGVLLKKHLQVGVNKGAISQETADAKFSEWKNVKDSKISGKADSLLSKKEAEKAARLAEETKVNAARAEAIAKKNAVVEEAPAAEEASQEVAEESAE